MQLIVVILISTAFALTTADFREDALVLHNKYRALHHSPPLTLSATLNKYAQNFAQHMANSNILGHSGGPYGENVYMSTPTKLSDSDLVKDATTRWYNEGSTYDYNKPGSLGSTGHFTQVVWKNSKNFGIGIARSSSGVYICGVYDPRGNVAGQFPQNVFRA